MLTIEQVQEITGITVRQESIAAAEEKARLITGLAVDWPDSIIPIYIRLVKWYHNPETRLTNTSQTGDASISYENISRNTGIPISIERDLRTYRNKSIGYEMETTAAVIGPVLPPEPTSVYLFYHADSDVTGVGTSTPIEYTGQPVVLPELDEPAYIYLAYPGPLCQIEFDGFRYDLTKTGEQMIDGRLYMIGRTALRVIADQPGEVDREVTIQC